MLAATLAVAAAWRREGILPRWMSVLGAAAVVAVALIIVAGTRSLRRIAFDWPRVREEAVTAASRRLVET